jgi:hypothetical protein
VASNRKLGNTNSSYHHHLAFSPFPIRGRGDDTRRGDTEPAITDPVASTREPSELRRPVSLTYAGGIVGAIIGWGIPMIINHAGTIPILVTPDMVILAVSASVGIGLFFGFYPAWNASRLNPIEALRSE